LKVIKAIIIITAYIDWCCFYYFVGNSLVALLEALCGTVYKILLHYCIVCKSGWFWLFKSTKCSRIVRFKLQMCTRFAVCHLSSTLKVYGLGNNPRHWHSWRVTEKHASPWHRSKW